MFKWSFRRSLFCGSLIVFSILITVFPSHAQDADQIKAVLEKADDGDKAILKWLSEHLVVSAAKDKKPRLFRRRNDVIAQIDIKDPEGAARIIDVEARQIVRVMSEAYNITYSFSSHNANILVLSASNISNGDKPNVNFLKRLGLEDRLIGIVFDAGGWKEGCGGYHFGDGSGTISLSLIVGDKDRLNASAMRDCIVTGLIRSFGLRAKLNTIPIGPTGFVPFLILGRTAHACSIELAHYEQQESIEQLDRLLQSRYVVCAYSKLKSR